MNIEKSLHDTEKEVKTIRKILDEQKEKWESKGKHRSQLYPMKLKALNDLSDLSAELRKKGYDEDVCAAIVFHTGRRIVRAQSIRELNAATRKYRTRYLIGNGFQKGFCLEEELVALTEAIIVTGKLWPAPMRRYMAVFRAKYPQFKDAKLVVDI